jgi:flagellar basal-body rod protein FlgB
MGDSRLFDTTFQMMGKSLDVSARRHNLITANIANMDTIGFEPRDIDFQKTLERALGKEPQGIEVTHENHFTATDPAHLSVNGSISEDVDLEHLDSVNIDTEMMNLVENNVKYRSTTEMLLRKMGMLRHVIQEGGR